MSSMRDFDANAEPATRDVTRRRGLSGWMVLLYLVGFFGTVMGVNGVLVYEALSTMSGVDTESAYQAGRMFEQQVAMAKAQDARHWRVDARLTPASNGARLDLSAIDAKGQPLGGMDAVAVFERPTDRRLDRSIDLIEDAAGRFHGNADIVPGQWDLVIEISRHGEQLFMSKNRIVFK
jgi:nitrogen fixation protein FixH